DKMSIFKNVVNLGLGFVVASKDKAEKVANELIKKGELNKKEGKDLVDSLMKQGKKTQAEIEKTVKKSVNGIFEKTNIPTRKEVNALRTEIAELRKKIFKKAK
ncbi:MAG: phasin family protein, partial [Elusimicrobiota bacterium]|nr:phasin family protein [Elusimicrobiota bacterium]